MAATFKQRSDFTLRTRGAGEADPPGAGRIATRVKSGDELVENQLFEVVPIESSQVIYSATIPSKARWPTVRRGIYIWIASSKKWSFER